jgi:holliday junction DNA helicase RuvA
MISQLFGSIIFRGKNYIVLDLHGVGYKVFVSDESLEKVANVGESPLRFYTYHAVREDAQTLYGFLEQKSLDFFELLITVSGIGPKTAMNILSVASVKTLESAVVSGNTSHLTKISGIGKKNAEKIVLELKDKVSSEGVEHGDVQDESDALEALKGLGYSERQAREALKQLDSAVKGTGNRVKQALKYLGKA